MRSAAIGWSQLVSGPTQKTKWPSSETCASAHASSQYGTPHPHAQCTVGADSGTVVVPSAPSPLVSGGSRAWQHPHALTTARFRGSCTSNTGDSSKMVLPFAMLLTANKPLPPPSKSPEGPHRTAFPTAKHSPEKSSALGSGASHQSRDAGFGDDIAPRRSDC